MARSFMQVGPASQKQTFQAEVADGRRWAGRRWCSPALLLLLGCASLPSLRASGSLGLSELGLYPPKFQPPDATPQTSSPGTRNNGSEPLLMQRPWPGWRSQGWRTVGPGARYGLGVGKQVRAWCQGLSHPGSFCLCSLLLAGEGQKPSWTPRRRRLPQGLAAALLSPPPLAAQTSLH